ncbi:MAG: hypothetical protein ACE5E6_01180 [Phycisphaerae bacterium]
MCHGLAGKNRERLKETITIRTAITIAITVGMITGLVTAPTMAATCTFNPPVGNTGTWGQAANWINCQNDFPGATDAAVIPTGKTCRILSAATREVEVLDVRPGGSLHIEGTGRLNLHGSATVDSKMSGNLRFVRTPGVGCPCDPAMPPAPGTLHIEQDLTLTAAAGSTVLIEGGCSSDLDSPCLNPGVISGAPGVVLTIDRGTAAAYTIKNHIQFDVALEVVGQVKFFVGIGPNGWGEFVDGQLMRVNENVHGDAFFLVGDGKLETWGGLCLTGMGGFDMGNSGGLEPEAEFNADFCLENRFCADDGTLDIHANVVALLGFHLGPSCVSPLGPCPSDGPFTIAVADGAALSFPRTAGTCKGCGCPSLP